MINNVDLPPYIINRLEKLQEQNKEILSEGQILNHIHFGFEKEDGKTILCFEKKLACPQSLWVEIEAAFRVPNHQE